MTADRIKALEDALRPFSVMAGEMFARNWNRGGVAILFEGGDETVRLTFDDFLAARAALAASRAASDCQQPDLVTAQAGQPITVQDAARVPEIAALIETVGRLTHAMSLFWEADEAADEARQSGDDAEAQRFNIMATQRWQSIPDQIHETGAALRAIAGGDA